MKNNTAFLEYVARDIIRRFGTQLADVAVVFPNKRASLFLNKYLVQLAGKPVWSPAYITISDLFRKHSALEVADHIELICRLYDVYCQCMTNGGNTLSGSLDHFYGWGELLLADFDDIDKNLGDADRIFTDLSNYQDLTTAPADMLDEQQLSQLRRLFGYFAETKSELKDRFNEIWGKLPDIYHGYRKSLQQCGLAYEGMLYREVAEKPGIDFKYRHYVFVGFNMMQQVEQQLFTRLKNLGKASFYWDFDKYYVAPLSPSGESSKTSTPPTGGQGGQGHEAGVYISKYLDKFKNSINSAAEDIYDNMSKPKDITYISAQTENIQARYICQWLKENGRMEAGERTAIVLADEKLLPAVVNNLPAGIPINITTGYPLALSPAASILNLLLTLRSNLTGTNGTTFRLSTVNKLLAHPYAVYISERAGEIRQQLNDQKTYFPTAKDLGVDEGMRLLFKQPENPLDIHESIEWITSVIEYVGKHSHGNSDAFFQESLFRTYTLTNRLKQLINSNILNISAATLERLISQIVATTTVPFHGEPAEGLQIMGVLETRNLDFDHVLMLSCNEGNMPKGVNDSSFIPYSIRKFHGLTTIDNKVAIYAYYFYRLMQRAGDITLTYNTTTEGTHTAEMSRFMLQMMVESGHTIKRKSITAGQSPCTERQKDVEKDERVMQKMLTPKDGKEHIFISPSALGNYLTCPMRYYFANVAGLSKLDDTDDTDIDARIFGNLFHSAAEFLYKDVIGKTLTQKDIAALSKNIDRCVEKAFVKELYNKDPETARLGRLNGLQEINSVVIKKYLHRLLKRDAANAPITILGTETWVTKECSINVGGKTISYAIGGIIDRLDRLEKDGRIRIVDYKTGKLPQHWPAELADIFDTKMNKTIPANYYLQAMLYASIVKEKQPAATVSPALLYIQQTSNPDYDPTLTINKEAISDIDIYRDEYWELLNGLVCEIFDESIPFCQTQDTERCTYCPFKQLCK